MDAGGLHRLSAREVGQGAAVLARAFREYPTFARLFPDERRRRRDLEHIMRLFLRCGLRHGEALAPSRGLEGIAVWYRSEALGYGLGSLLRAGLLGTFLGLGPRSFRRLAQLGAAKRANRARLLSRPYWFLDLVGVDPAQAGRGHARSLVEPKLAQADEEGRDCYLETSDPRNAAIYRRFGFAVVSTYEFDGVESICMLRAPAARG